MRVSPQFTDILNLIGHTYLKSTKPNYLCRLLTAYYLQRLFQSRDRAFATRALFDVDMSVFNHKSSARLSFPFPKHSFDLLVSVSRTERKSKSDLVKSIIIRAKSDMLDRHNSAIAKDFQQKIPELV